ncbi:hypothetical protein [Tepidimonas charontis]|uniref:Uncharacterized protein n=1 Tax=Tepidimonas charontis TaxID=2267262 RepID=A0A554XI40_9BURK|nr:hypothetical protein [Tepidimonas charontis]TSE35505.1 hypothetical protein Tchar_00701 [Tepidimonas charontis]
MVNAYRVIACAAALACVATLAKAAQYDSPKALLIQAIDAPDGKASGEIVGPVAERFRQATGSSAPVLADVSTIKSFQQEGCKRLQLRLRQGGVTGKDGKQGEVVFSYDLNLCRDGTPPTEGMDLERVGKVLGSAGVAEGFERLK